MATLNQHKEQIKLASPEGSIYFYNNGKKEAITGDDYDLWLTYSAESAKNKEDNEYKENRKKEYPALEDQLDYIFHNGLEAWKSDIIKPIKDKYPKP